ncbi:MAG: hypothetical protein ACLUNV_03545 [Sutterella wadsworthensis]
MTACREPARCEARTRSPRSSPRPRRRCSGPRRRSTASFFRKARGTIIVSPEAGEASPATLEDVTAIEPSLYAATDVGSFSFSRATTWSVSYYAKQLREPPRRSGSEDPLQQEGDGPHLRQRPHLRRGGGRARPGPTPSSSPAARAPVQILPEHAYGGVPLAPVTRSVLNVSLSGDACVMRHAVRTPEDASHCRSTRSCASWAAGISAPRSTAPSTRNTRRSGKWA